MSLVLLASALFFALVALRELSTSHVDSLLYGFLAAFFFTLHLYLLSDAQHSRLQERAGDPLLWSWLSIYLAPALIAMFLVFGIVWMVALSARTGLLKLFFGITLFCYLFVVGSGWPVDVKGILTVVYATAWFQVGLRTAA
jgi:uncharacterized membrane protein